MRRLLQRTLVTAAVLSGVAGIGPITAQAADPPAAALDQPAPATRNPPPPARRSALPVEQRISNLHARLHITPAQQPQWDRFADVMRENAQRSTDQFEARATHLASMTATENMQSYAQLATDQAEQVQRLVPAFQALYDTMSDSQKRAADVFFRQEGRQPPRK